MLNRNNLQQSFFQLSKEDPTSGFAFDASTFEGHTFPDEPHAMSYAVQSEEALTQRLRLGSHLALHMRRELENAKGYTATVGISTNKLLSKLVGNLNKPNGQTTLLPPYESRPNHEGNPLIFLDSHDIGKVPSIGFKMAQKLRSHVLGRDPAFDAGLVYGGTKESVKVQDVRLHPDLDPEKLERLLTGPGAPHGIGLKTWQLLHGIDDTEVAKARAVPRQISIEDSYIRLDTMPEVIKELNMLARSLLNRMHLDLLADDTDDEDEEPGIDRSTIEEQRQAKRKRWLAHPRTLRLTTRPRQPLNADGSRTRSFKRISHSGPLPSFVFNLSEPVSLLAEKLVREALVPMFRHLHPPARQGWNLSLVNVGVTNMVETAGTDGAGSARDIGRMFRRQEGVLREFRVVEDDARGEEAEVSGRDKGKGRAMDVDDEIINDHRRLSDGEEGEEVEVEEEEEVVDDGIDDEEEAGDVMELAVGGLPCEVCGLSLPAFAIPAHQRYHELGD